MRAFSRALLLSATVLLAPGCRQLADSLFVVEIENEEICKTQRSAAFVGAPPDVRSIQHVFEFPLGDLGADLPEGRLETELRLRLFELTVTGGGADLSGVEYGKVSLRRPGSSESIRTLLEYHRPATVHSPQQIVLRGVEAVEVPELARDSVIELVFEAHGDLPPQDWTADIHACAGLWARVHYFDVVF